MVIACFPVYRCYVSAEGVSDTDVKVVEIAVNDAATRSPKIKANVLHFIRDSVLLRYPVSSEAHDDQLQFAQRFQQLTSPVNAKGIEDTTFYIYNRLTSLNEVGGDPGRFGRSVEALHHYFQDRNLKWPSALSALSTHDTKRSEDVRARISILSEIPDQWSERLERWRELNANLCKSVHSNDQYLSLSDPSRGVAFGAIDEDSRQQFVERITAYMQKAMREAKERTTWTAPNTDYETAVSKLIRDLVDPEKSSEFLKDFVNFQKKISSAGLVNSISQTTIRLMAPGVPDTYQGSEVWDFSLVDPDNRRPVDYGRRSQMLSDLSKASAKELISTIEDGRIKLWVTSKLLHLRKRLPDIFTRGGYQVIRAEGERQQNIFAFARTSKTQSIIVVIPRLIARLGGEENKWSGTKIVLPAKIQANKFEDVFTGQSHTCGVDRSIAVSPILEEFPVAVLLSK